MEKILVKIGIYSFVTSFFLLIIFLQRENETVDGDGMTSTFYTPFPEYFFTIFRYSVIASVLSVIVAGVFLWSDRPKKEDLQQ